MPQNLFLVESGGKCVSQRRFTYKVERAKQKQ